MKQQLFSLFTFFNVFVSCVSCFLSMPSTQVAIIKSVCNFNSFEMKGFAQHQIKELTSTYYLRTLKTDEVKCNQHAVFLKNVNLLTLDLIASSEVTRNQCVFVMLNSNDDKRLLGEKVKWSNASLSSAIFGLSSNAIEEFYKVNVSSKQVWSRAIISENG